MFLQQQARKANWLLRTHKIKQPKTKTKSSFTSVCTTKISRRITWSRETWLSRTNLRFFNLWKLFRRTKTQFWTFFGSSKMNISWQPVETRLAKLLMSRSKHAKSTLERDLHNSCSHRSTAIRDRLSACNKLIIKEMYLYLGVEMASWLCTMLGKEVLPISLLIILSISKSSTPKTLLRGGSHHYWSCRNPQWLESVAWTTAITLLCLTQPPTNCHFLILGWTSTKWTRSWIL
jgi:hypothetical protein